MGSLSQAVRIEHLESRLFLSGTYHLAFDDEFNAFQLWNGTAGWNSTDLQGNRTGTAGQQQYYADPTVPGYNPFSVSGGVLSITADHTPAGMSAAGKPYVSGMISTASDFAFQYGYIEMRAKLPAGQGFWPAFWLIPANGVWPPEYDIFEVLGHEPNKIFQNSHWQSTTTGNQTGIEHTYTGVDSSTAFHTYGLQWDQNNVSWYVDGVVTQTIPNVFFQPAYILANLAVGGSWPGNPDGTTPFPSSMQIDYVRVYSTDPNVPTVGGQTGYSQSAVVTQLNASTLPTTPLPWDSFDVGNPTLDGSASHSGGTWTITAAGTMLGLASDQVHFAYQKTSGDASIEAKVETFNATDPWAKAGVMFRESSKGNARFASVSLTPSSGVTMQWRTSPGATASATTISGVAGPIWVRINRTGNSFQGQYSTNGTTWTTINTVTVDMNSGIYEPDAAAYAGLHVTSRNAAQLKTATFSNVSSTAYTGQFTTAGDINAPAIAGSTYTNGLTYVVKGSGAGITGYADQFHMLRKSWTGDATVIARITSMTNTDQWAKSGVMLRNSTAAGSMFAAVLATPTNGVRFAYRSTTNGAATGYFDLAVPMPSATSPLWVKLTRVGNSFAGYYSADGLVWTKVGSNVTIGMSGTALAGLAVSSNNVGSTNTSTFTNVSLSNVLGQFASAGDLGTPGIAGATTWDGKTYTLNGGGAAWTTTDHGQFISQSWTGDGTFTAKVTSSEWAAKAGIMFRNSSAADSPFVSLAIAEGTLYFQYRATAGGSITTAASYARWTPAYDRPIWLRLTRSGNTWTAEWSKTGTDFKDLNDTNTPTTATVALSSSTLTGIFVNARDNTKLRTATFTDLILSL